jgi:hypothetical protein
VSATGAAWQTKAAKTANEIDRLAPVPCLRFATGSSRCQALTGLPGLFKVRRCEIVQQVERARNGARSVARHMGIDQKVLRESFGETRAQPR